MRILPTLVLAATLGLAAPGFARSHDHGHAPAPAAATAPARRYATDAPLREGMQGIRAAVDALGHYEHGHMGPEQAAILAGNIQAGVNDIIAKCKLPPDADAALHAIIVPLMTQATALKQDPTKLEAIPPMRQALADYADRFDDPGFAPAAEPEEAR
jgi:hypothetical protein